MYRGKYESGKGGSVPRRPVKPSAVPQVKPDEIPQPEEIEISVVNEIDEVIETNEVIQPVVETRPIAKKKSKQKKRSTVGTKIFYGFYFVLVIAMAAAIVYGLNMLKDWLVSYEVSQPHTKSQQIFDQLFADPNWEEIYEMAGPEDTKFESKDAFVRYMEQKIGSNALTYKETSAGLSGGQKYIIRLGEENIGTFTLTNSVTDELEIPQWELDSVEIFVSYDEYVTLTLRQGRNVSINGVALDGSYIIRTTSTVAEDYLPEGVHGLTSATYYVEDFLVTPEVAVTDENGNAVELSYDAETRTYTETIDTKTFDMPEDARLTVIDAAQTYSKFMITAVGKNELKQKFDPDSSTYKSITRSDLWTVQGYSRYAFTEPSVSEYYRYSDDLFSARIAFDMNITRTNGTIKTFSLDTTFFLEKTESGSWMVTSMTNVDVQELLSRVRITYMLDGEILQTGMVDVDAALLTPPEVTAPEGKVFAGWFLESTDENGDTTMTLAFNPDETGTVLIPSDYTLEPMVLQALFEDEGA